MQNIPTLNGKPCCGLFDGLGKRGDHGFERVAAPSWHMGLSVAHQKDAQLFGGEQVLAAVENLFENGCGVGYRIANNLQHLGGRLLLLQRLPGLVEQPRVFDRDDGLVGESLEQLDVMVGE